ncbi:hypothetical protein [Streptomyces sp. MBT53]|uniref:hypothetical protein n=1 Tax=Streptomyces sp. MBT53 TaxID=1488384 RepID=UPI00191330C8|nr:hypothetical protein [Streptomyces sp. MBT53]MBK6015520.1 hypothetical protein [Streptomyces sp. MBT53]
MVVHHHNRAGRVKEYDFSAMPVAEPMQRSLAAVFAGFCRPGTWGAHTTSEGYWYQLEVFTKFLAGLENPPRDLDEITSAVVKQWRLGLGTNRGSYHANSLITRLLLSDGRLQTGPVADELAVRRKEPKSQIQSYSEAEFDEIKVAARRMFRSALLRIRENAQHLERWRQGDYYQEGSQGWLVGQALDILARTGDLPRSVHQDARPRIVIRKYAKALGGRKPAMTWQRLFLSRMEAVALGVLLMAEYGWNLSVIDHAEVPRALPDPGEDGHPTYRIPLEKYRRGAGHHYETRNVTDDGAASQGRLITQALEATSFARAIVENLVPGTDRLIVWRTHKPGRQQASQDRLPPVSHFHFGIHTSYTQEWAHAQGFSGAPFQRGRRTVNALDRRQPGQNSQETHDRRYVLVDKRVQAEAVEVIAVGAEDAALRARTGVLAAELREQPTAGDVETATADCSDYNNGPHPAPEGGCGASFLMCLGCQNARVHPGHHGRLAHLHTALTNLRSVVPPPAWKADWGETHERLEDLKDKLGAATWSQALAQVGDADRELIRHLLTGDLDT